MARYVTVRGESGLEIEVELNDSDTAREVWSLLPFEGMAGTWGEEVHLRIPLEAEPEPGAREGTEVGEVAYQPESKSLCLFFGPTPASVGDKKPRATSAVNVVGKISGGLEDCWGIGAGDPLRLEGSER